MGVLHPRTGASRTEFSTCALFMDFFQPTCPALQVNVGPAGALPDSENLGWNMLGHTAGLRGRGGRDANPRSAPVPLGGENLESQIDSGGLLFYRSDH